jgi:hypothetical protein
MSVKQVNVPETPKKKLYLKKHRKEKKSKVYNATELRIIEIVTLSIQRGIANVSKKDVIYESVDDDKELCFFCQYEFFLKDERRKRKDVKSTTRKNLQAAAKLLMEQEAKIECLLKLTGS